MGIFSNIFGKDKSKEKIQPYHNSSDITIGVGQDSDDTTEYKKESVESEEDICIAIRDNICKVRKPKYQFEIRHRSSDYTTLAYRNSDIVRVKWTPMSKWLALQIGSSELYDKYANDPIFAGQADKEKIQWKVNCTSTDDLERLMPIILDVFDDVDHFEVHFDLTDTEQLFVNAAARAMAEVTEDPDNIYLQKTTEHICVMYKGSTGCMVTFKIYKRKSHRLYVDSKYYKFLKTTGLYVGNKNNFHDYIEFTDPEVFKRIKPIIKEKYDNFKEHEKMYTDAVELSYLQNIKL